jgi:hypothetical protein
MDRENIDHVLDLLMACKKVWMPGKVLNESRVDDDFWRKAGVGKKEMAGDHCEEWTWGALDHRIRRKGSTDSATALKVVRYLLTEESKGRLVAKVRRPSRRPPPPSSDGTPAEEGLQISCPKKVYDSRAVIVGQLPRANRAALEPIVFVKPNEKPEYWYPQLGEHNPLVVGRAFACLAHFGNPNGIGQRQGLPQTYDVRVYALAGRWPAEQSEHRLRTGELDALIGPLRDQGLMRKGLDCETRTGVCRHPAALRSFRIRDANKHDLSLTLDKPITCLPPLTLTWKGEEGARIEIRAGTGDDVLCDCPVHSPLALPLRKGRKRCVEKVSPYLIPGLSRVRLYPLQMRTFLDPSWEWFFEVK